MMALHQQHFIKSFSTTFHTTSQNIKQHQATYFSNGDAAWIWMVFHKRASRMPRSMRPLRAAWPTVGFFFCGCVWLKCFLNQQWTRSMLDFCLIVLAGCPTLWLKPVVFAGDCAEGTEGGKVTDLPLSFRSVTTWSRLKLKRHGNKLTQNHQL